MTAAQIFITFFSFIIITSCITYSTVSRSLNAFRLSTKLSLIPKDIPFSPNQIEIVKILGKIENIVDKQILEEISFEIDRYGDDTAKTSYRNWLSNKEDGNRVTSIRIFEARIPGGSRCFIKEYLPVGYLFGKRELSASRRLISKWNDLLQEGAPVSAFPPTPIIFGSLRTDERILDPNFRRRWMKIFPKAPPPAEGNLWLLFRWDESTFRTLKSFPTLPQVIEGLDYFIKQNRVNKRWRFIRKIIRKVLEAVDYIHRCGYCHNALSSDSIWLTTTDQQEYDILDARVTDLGSTQKTSELGPYARTQIMEDLYQLGFIVLQLIIASFCDRNNLGARQVRSILAGIGTTIDPLDALMTDATKIDQSQLRQQEFQRLFEGKCDSDFQNLRVFVRSIPDWQEAADILDADEGAAWKLIFKLLARGRLYDSDREKPLKVSGLGLVKESEVMFGDTYD